jgi:glyoxalase superfamily protein
MALARWKDLCLDAADPSVAASFWGTVLGLEASIQDSGDAVLRGSSPGQTIWVNRVPEPKSVKNRVHLDLVGPPLDTWLDLGASVLQKVTYDHVSWTVLADPEGNELCVFDQADAPTALVVDSADPEGDARWWGEVLGGEVVVAPGGLRRWVTEVDSLPWQVVKFVGVAEPKTVKNRVHWDVVCDDVPGLVDRGSRLLRAPDDEVSWHVLADPAGNEFCAFAP